MFTKAEEALIQELRDQKAPIERWAKFFPGVKVSDLLEKKPIFYLYGKPVYSGGYVESSYLHINPCSELPCNPTAYAASMKKGNVYKWDDIQDAFLASKANMGYTIKEIIHLIHMNFGIKRTEGAIESRLASLGLILR